MVYNMVPRKIKDHLSMPLAELLVAADRVRRRNFGPEIDLCGIFNAKSGACSEDCKFCAQSAHHSADIHKYSLRGVKEVVKAARKARKNGACRFGIVTSGNRLTPDEINTIALAIKAIRNTVDIRVCASLGALDRDAFRILKDAGLERYHHNIETSPRYYKTIVTTHDHNERTRTINAAQNAGLEVCSGGIIGMGETWQDRIEMALLLKKLDVDSVPLNILVPIKGTLLEHTERISPLDIVRTIAIFRIILKDRIIRIAAGREAALKDHESLIFMAGANGMMIGGYLTVGGRSVEEDLALVREIEGSWKKESKNTLRKRKERGF